MRITGSAPLRVMVAALVCVVAMAGGTGGAAEQTGSELVKITPLGTHAGEFCRDDRGFLFEDPSGVRILYDPGRPVDENDPRLGDVHVMLLSHAHTDHIGDTRPNATPGNCAAPASGPSNPDSNFVGIAARKNAAVFAAGELPAFLGRKIQVLRGTATPGCATVGIDNETSVPLASVCTAALRPGGSRTVRRAGASAAVRIASVMAIHANGIPGALLESPAVAPGTTAYGGGESGFIIRFTNGLSVYLSGDTGMFGDMELIIARYYQPRLVVLNMGDVFGIGPDEAAFTLKNLVRPRTVMPSHSNEQSSSGGQLIRGSKVDRMASQISGLVDVVLPLSGVTRMFDGDGRCIACQ